MLDPSEKPANPSGNSTVPQVPTSDTKSIHHILAQFRDEELHNRHLGDRFERLICRYLELDPLFADRFSNVWMWNEWPKKGKSGDTGIDIVAEERATGEFCGIQCKFYLPENTLSAPDLDSYFAALGDARFSSGIIISTTDKWGPNAEKRLQNPTKPVNRLRVQDLDESPIDWSKFSLKHPQALSLKKKKTLRPHQKSAKTDIITGLAVADRGKLIMACGTGKTFTSLRTAEEIAPAGHVLFLVPSLSLLSQSLREWTAEAENSIHALAVCSDVNIGKRSNRDAPSEDDTADFQLSDLAFPATTSAKDLVRSYRHIIQREKKGEAARMTVVFSTYHSIQAVADAQKAGLPHPRQQRPRRLRSLRRAARQRRETELGSRFISLKSLTAPVVDRPSDLTPQSDPLGPSGSAAPPPF